MSSHDAKVLQHLVLNLASSVESRAVNIRTFLEEAFRHLGDEHYLLNALLAIRKEVDLMEQDAKQGLTQRRRGWRNKLTLLRMRSQCLDN
jgi:hypothetical protein